MSLLAIDLGLRAGVARFGRKGFLREYGSTNFGSRARLRQGAAALVQSEGIDALIVEGDSSLAKPFIRTAERQKVAEIRRVQADTWRRDLLRENQRASGAIAKRGADEIARRLIERSVRLGMVSRPTSLRHDAAEAICLGYWMTHQLGWIERIEV